MREVNKARTPYLEDIKNPTTDRNSDQKEKFFNNKNIENYGLSQNSTIIEPDRKRLRKIDVIREKARHIEETAHRKEQLMKYNKSSIGDNMDVNDMLIDAISAKLQILDNL